MSRIVKILIGACVAVYAAQVLLGGTQAGLLLNGLGGLSGAGLRQGFLWQLVTYQFLHGSPMHLFFNMFALYMFGSAIEAAFGPRRFVGLYLLSGVLGGLGYALIEPRHPCIGASASVFGVLAAFATIHPRAMISLLFPPVTLSAWQFVLILAGMDFLFLVSGVQGRIAYAAHVGGAITGFIYASMWSGRWPRWIRGLIPERGLRFTRADPAAPPPIPPPRWSEENGAGRRARAEAERELNRVLDKLSREGWQALTAAERTILDRASRDRRAR
jgi:membrane associated rhomboid family serine protease